jgi:AcrR family transcriptional regulator
MPAVWHVSSLVTYPAPLTTARDTQTIVSPASAKKQTRRTQAERRATTRTALLDAAVDCLVEDGYAKTTTRRIAQRAGVSRGALQHHFSSKAELLGDTIGHIRAKWASEMLAQGVPATPSIRERHEQLLDRMWRLYRGPLFQALLELGFAARTDPELRHQIVGAHGEMGRWNATGIPVFFPEFADRPELAQLLATGQATMRGLALAGLAGEWDPDEAWPETRAHIMAMHAQVLDDPELSPQPQRQRAP